MARSTSTAALAQRSEAKYAWPSVQYAFSQSGLRPMASFASAIAPSSLCCDQQMRARAQGNGRRWLLKALDALAERPDFRQLGLPDLLNHLVESGHRVQVLYVNGHWLDVNNPDDLRRAVDFAHGGLGGASEGEGPFT